MITQAGSNVNLSGGTINVATGYINQTWLTGSNGQLYNASQAPANLSYTGVYQGFEDLHARWGKTATAYYSNPLIGPQRLLQNGYTVGRDAGRLMVSAPTAVLEGAIVASVYNGPQQNQARVAGVTDGYKLGQGTAALPGALMIGQYGAYGLSGGFNTDVLFGNVAGVTQGLSLNDVLPAGRSGTTWLDAAWLNAQGLGGLSVAGAGTIAVNSSLQLANGGALNFVAPQIDIHAGITVRSGNISMGNLLHGVLGVGQAEQWWSLTDGNGKAGINIATGSVLDLRGVWANIAQNPSAPAGLPYINGGTLSLDTTGSITVATGSLLDVSAGASIMASGQAKGGAGGNVSLLTNDYGHRGYSVDYAITDRSAPLVFDGSVRAFGFNGSGTLKILAPQTIFFSNDPSRSGTISGPVLALNPALLQSGFTGYDITGMAGMQIDQGASLVAAVPVYRFTDRSYAAASGSNPADVAAVWQPPAYLDNPAKGQLTQRIGADLTLATGGDFHLQRNASITVDPGHAINIYANGQATVDGRMTAHSGNITINSLQDLNSTPLASGGYGDFSLTRSIWIGGEGVLDVSAQAATVTNPAGHRYGTVAAGGTIILGGGGADGYATDAFIIVRPGALLDASGTTAMLDVQNGNGSKQVQVASSGGAIVLHSNSGIYLDGDLRAAAGGAGASGGSLSLDLVSRYYGVGAPVAGATGSIGTIPAQLQALRNITLTQQREASGLNGSLAPGQGDAALLFGQAAISVEQIQAGGFDSLSLRTSDLLRFKGDINLSLGRSLALAGVYTAAEGSSHSNVTLSAPYVRLDGYGAGSAPYGVYYPGLSTERGTSIRTSNSNLTVKADLIDVNGDLRFGMHAHQGSGSLDFSTPAPSTDDSTHTSGPDIVDALGFGNVSLQSAGDIRLGNTSVFVGGNLNLKAGQIYPISGVNAILSAGLVLTSNMYGGIGQAAFLPDAAITIRGNDDNGGAAPAIPASVFGSVALVAPTIDQGGVLRAPLGLISFNKGTNTTVTVPPETSKVIFRSGSLTSASAQGLILSFGGTADGVTYTGIDGTLVDLGATHINRNGSDYVTTGISVNAGSIVGESGAVLDLSGGGVLAGAGFVSGRGGSVDMLKTALVNGNPFNGGISSGKNQVYAILPGYASQYAPLIASNGAGNPDIGRQITIGEGVPGLAAGTYTLLPSSYAMLPGAFRVELSAGNSAAVPATTVLPNGSYLAGGMLGIANTGILDALPTQVILTSGQMLRRYASYNETSYDTFARTQATQFGGVRPRLPEDGKILELGFTGNVTDKLSFAGTARFDGAGDGIGGSLMVSAASGALDITAPGATPVAGHTSIASADLNKFQAPTLFLGGYYGYYLDTASGTGSRIYFNGFGTTNVLDGATIRAGEVFLIGNNVNVSGGAIIDTRGMGSSGLDSRLGYVFGNVYSEKATTNGPAVLAVSNGWLNFLPVVGNSSINVQSGASLLTEGSVVLAAPGGLTMGDVNFGARYLTVAQDQINAGDAVKLAAAQAAGVLPAGWNLSQDVLDKLLRPSSTAGAPVLEQLTLTAGGAINLFGDLSLDATGRSAGHDLRLVVNTPAIYGAGAATDSVSIKADRFIWNGIRTGNGTASSPYGSKAPAAIIAGGAGTGSGQLTINAREILFGYDIDSRPTDGVTLDRVALGFSALNLNAEKISSNTSSTLSLGQTRDASGALQGGDLHLNAPVLTVEKGTNFSYAAGGAIIATAGARVAGDSAGQQDLGGSLSLRGNTIYLDTTVALPSGKLTLDAVQNVTLGAGSRIDLAGRGIAFYDLMQYSAGGDLIISSDHGNVVQAAGSLIDVSARNNNAGSVSVSAIDAAQGVISLGGSINGMSAGGEGGRLSVQAQSVGDFSAFNQMLNQSGFFGARSFAIKRGDLVVGDEVRAHDISISADGGSLTVNGKIDASGKNVGVIRLAARDALTLNAGSVLDAHGTQLQTDSYGAPIEAGNTAQVALSSSQGDIIVRPGATIDLRDADAAMRGKLSFNAQRMGSDGAGDIAIDAAGNVNILGAGNIGVNGFRTYTLAAGGTVDQAYLDALDADSRVFINAAWSNTSLQNRLAGLKAYGGAFHLRPGVEIASSGDLSTSGDLDLSGYRYGPNANPAVRGSGEAGVMTLRAGGKLSINGSISDGFAPPPGSPDNVLIATVFSNATLTSNYTVPTGGLKLESGARLPTAGTLNFDVTLSGAMVLSNTHPLPVDVTVNQNVPLLGGATLASNITNPDGSILVVNGVQMRAGTTIPASWTNQQRLVKAGSIIKAGMNMAFAATGQFVLRARPVLWPAGNSLAFFSAPTTSAVMNLPAGAILPTGTFVVTATAASGERKDIWAIAPMLAPGSQSWSMRLVGGADLSGADSRALQSLSALTAAGSGDVVLNDPFDINVYGSGNKGAGISVIRTGTGDLEILAGRDYQQKSLYGVYTAGTSIAATGSAVNVAYNLGRALLPDGTVLGAANAAYEATLGTERMYYAEHGGNFSLSAQGDIVGAPASYTAFGTQKPYGVVGDWLWRQGGAGIGQATAWGINFGSYVADYYPSTYFAPYGGLAAFVGLGALGGGNVTIQAGGDIGNAGRGIIVAIGGSGRVMPDGSLAQTGGGNMSVIAGGNVGTGGNQFVNVRGDINVNAGSFGTLSATSFGYSADKLLDPRPANTLTPYAMTALPGGSFAPGDGVVNINVRGDLAIGDVTDPGRVGLRTETDAGNGSVAGRGASWFSLWTDRTAVNLFAAGGNASPLATGSILPAILRATAASGSLYLTPSYDGRTMMMPSSSGELQLLAQGGIIGNPFALAAIGPLATSSSTLATPFKPGWVLRQSSGQGTWNTLASNYWGDPNNLTDSSGSWSVYDYAYDNNQFQSLGNGGTPFVFGANTISDNSVVSSGIMSHIYAVNGDIDNLRYGETYIKSQSVGGQNLLTTNYHAAKPVQIAAGGDIVNFNGVVLQDSVNDISTIAAGGNIIYASLQMAGPGTLEVSAGKNIYQGSTSSFESLGPMVIGDRRAGASIVLQAGLGSGAPGIGQVDWTNFAKQYLDPANLAGSGPLANQPGKVAKTYGDELYAWLQQRFAYGGGKNDALAYFMALPSAQQRVFLRQVYYDELRLAGREYNDPASSRYGSYLRGREAISTLFPGTKYQGDIIMFSAKEANSNVIDSSFIHTDFGGDIQLLAPGGKVLVGSEGLAPGADAGLMTQGEGNILIYSQGSLLLGLSRVMTTFGGDILAWSAQGDINAGRGAKTTVLYTPPKRIYDNVGDVTLSPQVPSNGAGIATLAPIPEVPAGDIDLIAPLGTIDAGEAGIRVSGNVNLAALQVVNAANIQVQGKATGIPMIAAVNVGALTNASAAASSAAAAAQDTVQRARNEARQALPSIFTVRVLGFGNEAPAAALPGSVARDGYDANSPVQVLGQGRISDQQKSRLTSEEKRLLGL
ncbi:filamentous haemagglutinin family protein [Herbaspirillum chlorophenolicum]|uniref:filamentous haemagglutinin family protein n=2 Tax=Herbaspirillum chlorophenolicum TaxID=211589 RepID=UPI00067AB757|nr:filamentous haemagglutinin family protein [Herbaspirillum chlorophenolicum]